jgi:hypothetical protein
MAKFKYNMGEREAILEFKKAINGKIAIMKDNGAELAVGGPGMTVKVKFANGIVETSASLFGKAMLGTVNTAIELINGFEKI